MGEEINEVKVKETPKKVKKDSICVADQIKKNPWILGTIVFGILAILLLLGIFSPTGQVSKNLAGKNFVDYINSQGGSQIEYVSSADFGSSLYEVTVLAGGEKVPVHITRDGKYFVQILSSMTAKVVDEPKTNAESIVDLPKSDKPLVELFVMSHCPYGTQAEKGMLPVVELLGDKIDFKLRFVYYAMHPSYGEVEEQLNQYCIQEEQEELLNEYLTCFLGTTGTPEEAQECLDEVGIDKTKLESCASRVDKEFDVLENLEDTSSWLNGRFPLFNLDKELNEEYGVRGSPSLVVNGQEASSARDPASYLATVCAAFNDVPEECSETLDSTAYNPGFGWSESSSGSTAAQCA